MKILETNHGGNWLLMILSLFLLGCTQEPAPDTKPITLTLVSNSAEIRQQCGVSPLEPYGCAKQKDAGRCEIVAIKPRGFDDHAAIETLGHELWHCFHGEVHD